MLKGPRKYIFIFTGLVLLIALTQYFLPQPVSWRRTYTEKDKIPYGCNAIYRLLPGTFSKKVEKNRQTLYNLKDKLKEKSTVLLINSSTAFNRSDVRNLFEILKKGHTVFIASSSFADHLADTFHLRSDYLYYEYFSSIDTLLKKKGGNIRLSASNLNGKAFTYNRAAWISAFTNFDSSLFRIRARAGEEKKACALEASVGKGKLILVSAPDIFSNFFIVDHPNRELAYALLSHAKNDVMIWDEYYNGAIENNESFLRLILGSDALYSAWILMLLSIIFYMFTEGKRRQRVIPVTEPVKNTTLEFVDVVTHVYYSSKSHQDIAAEKIRYFYEFIRKKFNVITAVPDDAFCAEISELSGVEYKTVRQLFVYCERLRTAGEISEHDLIELNRQITNFIKNSLR